MKASPFAELDAEAHKTHAALERRVVELASGRPLKGFVAADEDDALVPYPWEQDAGGKSSTNESD